MDLKKAFNTADHEILLAQLRTYCLGNDTIEWFRSYLDRRYKSVKHNGTNPHVINAV